MQGKREMTQQSGVIARTRLTSPRHTPHGDTTRQARRGVSRPHVERPPENAAARAKAAGAGAESFLPSSTTRGQSREEEEDGVEWRGHGSRWTVWAVSNRSGRGAHEGAMMIGAWAFRDPASPATIFDWYRRIGWVDRPGWGPPRATQQATAVFAAWPHLLEYSSLFILTSDI